MNDHFKVRPPYARLIAATDGSELGGMALVGAAQLARRTKAELYVFHAAGDIEGEPAVRRQAAKLLEGILHKVEIRNLIAGTPTSPARLVREFADEVGDSLVVVGSHGRSGIRAALLGSTTAELVSRPGEATVVYGPNAVAPTEVNRVVACVDGSQFSELSLAEAALWCVALKVPMVIVQVVPPGLPPYVAVFEDTYVHNLSKELEGLGRQAIESEVLHSGTPATAILESFGEDPATMLVMATHGRVGFKRVVMGSVASEVVRRAHGPVVLIRPVDPTAGDSQA